MDKQRTCEERISSHLQSRLEDLRLLWTLYCEKGYEASDPDLGSFDEYGLCFDYVAPRTFHDQKRAYFRYQLSCGGPSDEFRFYVNPDFSLYEVQYWFLDWFDGAGVMLEGDDYNLLAEIYDFFSEIGSVDAAYKKEYE
jgi:hypothetical protein